MTNETKKLIANNVWTVLFCLVIALAFLGIYDVITTTARYLDKPSIVIETDSSLTKQK